MADRADKYICYEASVQCVEAEIDFVDATFFELRKRRAQRLREDFCGTANTSCEWVRRRRTNTAISVDRDLSVLDWSKQNKVAKLPPGPAKRLTMVNGDVLKIKTDPVDMVLAMNFSYWLLLERRATIRYFKRVRDALVDDGIFFLDAYGGYEAFQEVTEETQNETCTYIWEQYKYSPVTGIAKNYIHFKFEDGSEMRRAFAYDWRVWTLPELTDMLSVAGFKPTVYWEQTDAAGEGNGVFEPETEGEADAGWIAYLVAEK